MSSEPDEILTTKEAAKLLKISVAHIKNQANAGKIPGRKYGKLWRFSKLQLLENFRKGTNV